MEHSPRILAVCVNWNGGEVLSATVDSLLNSRYPRLDVWVVDNASTDGSPDLLPDRVRVLKLERNLGYGGALNRALAEATGGSTQYRYLFLINNDLTVPPETIPGLVSCARENHASVVAPKTLLAENTRHIEAAWGKISWSHVLVDFKGKGADASDPRWNRCRPAQILLGNALLIERELPVRIGCFDERFFMYHEEADLLYRAWKQGFTSFYCGRVSVIHRGGHSTRRQPLEKVYWTRRNSVLFLRKYHAAPLQWSWFFLTLVSSLLWNVLTLKHRRIGAIVRGIAEGFRFDMNQPATGDSAK